MLRGKIDKLHGLSLREAARRTRLFKTAKWVTTLLWPIWSVLFFQFYKETSAIKLILTGKWTLVSSFDVESVIFILVFFIHTICASIIILFERKDTVEQYFDLKEAFDHIKEYEDNKREFFKLMEVMKEVSANIQAVYGFIDGIPVKVSRQDILDWALAPLLSALPRIFRYSSHEHYNFQIYVHDHESDLLVCRYRYRDDDFDEAKPEPSRSWRLGQGHIGQCYAADQGFVVEDLTKESTFAVRSKPGDALFYRSVLSSPLHWIVGEYDEKGVLGVEEEVYGVMLLTSSQPGQFQRQHLQAFEALSSATQHFIYELERRIPS